MADIQFQGEPTYTTRAASGPTGIAGKFISWGLASNEQGAARVMMIVAVVAIALAIGIYFFATGETDGQSIETGTLIPGPNGSKTYAP